MFFSEWTWSISSKYFVQPCVQCQVELIVLLLTMVELSIAKTFKTFYMNNTRLFCQSVSLSVCQSVSLLVCQSVRFTGRETDLLEGRQRQFCIAFFDIFLHIKVIIFSQLHGLWTWRNRIFSPRRRPYLCVHETRHLRFKLRILLHLLWAKTFFWDLVFEQTSSLREYQHVKRNT